MLIRSLLSDRTGRIGAVGRSRVGVGGADAGVSGREAEVLAAGGEHLTNAEIAARLVISIRTVESHVSSLLRKLGGNDRRGAWGVPGGGGPPPPAAPPAPPPP